MSGYLIIDGNSLGHHSQGGRKLSLGEFEVHAIYHFLRGLRQHIGQMPGYTPVVCWDGASWRKMAFPDYKSNRDRADTKYEVKRQAEKASYEKQVPHIKKALKLLGVDQLWALNMEADDLGAILCKRWHGSSIVLLTGDQDWIQLVEPGVIWRDFAQKRIVSAQSFEEYTGVKTPRQFVEAKALSGDGGDSVPGVGGIGMKGAVEFLNTYGSVADFLNMALLEKSIDVAKLPKKFRQLVEDEEKALLFQRNLDLVDLRTTARPAPQNLTVTKGEPSRAQFERFCEILAFRSILDGLDDWLSVFPAFRTIPA